MTRTITALFDKRADAEAAEARLKASNVDAGHICIHDQSTQGYSADKHSTHTDMGMWASVKNALLPDEDRHTYEEGVRRGGFLLTADVGEEHIDDAVKVLEEADTVDIDERSNQWRQSGWDYAPGAAPTVGAAAYGTTAAPMKTETNAAGEEVVPIIEEQLVVGKREVDRGGARVRSYVTETAVHEQVRLRDEKINVQRRAVDRPMTDADDAFRERTIDMTATGEEAVVGKTARVVEEVVISKTAGEHVEEINDTVRRTDVEIDEDKGTSVDPTYKR
ncbi:MULTISPECIES: YsnF/AvaK domain-containing protein [unclassified Sphingomonas]|uniref:YsnF/AvaK domain-containing protein n=1 Tax=unclassified Sphingomonas TaxID=196159 RepID=UPI00226ACCEB|nr:MULTISPECIES: YsnF/AvaK domain-containing protein [unclassified Sphingomonas]